VDVKEERLSLCWNVEKESLSIYRILETRFPDVKVVFHSLAVSEEHHIELEEKAKLSHRKRTLPPEFVPNSTLELEHTLYHLRKTKNLLSDGPGLKQTCALALEFENLTGERYMQEVIQGKKEMEMDKEIADLLRVRSDGERAHS